MHAGDRNQGEDQYPVADVAEEVAEPEAHGEQPPEGRIAPALAISGVARAADREAREGGTGEDIKPVEVDHDLCPGEGRDPVSSSGLDPGLRRGTAANFRSSSSSR